MTTKRLSATELPKFHEQAKELGRICEQLRPGTGGAIEHFMRMAFDEGKAEALSVQPLDHLAYVIAHSGFEQDATGGCSCETCADLRKRIASIQKQEGEQYYAERYGKV